MEITARLVADATVRTTPSGKALTGFRVALNRTYRVNGERREKTTYIDCAYWRGTKVASYLTKGLLVRLVGEISASAWVSRDGELMAGLTFNAREIGLISASASGQARPQGNNQTNRQ